MISILNEKKLKAIHLKNEDDFICIYRYLSLVISSIFYIFGGYGNNLILKLIIVICVSLQSILMNYLYVKNRNYKKVIKCLVIMDVIGTIFILIPTGGLNSPYIGYSLNTIFITISYLNIYYCIFDVAIYLLLSSELYSLSTNYELVSLKDIFLNNYNIILAYLLITAALYLLFNLLRELDFEKENLLSKNEELKQANITINELLESTMALYRTMNYISNENDKKQAANIIIEYTKNITKSERVFLGFLENNNVFIETDGCEEIEEEIKTFIKRDNYKDINFKKYNYMNIKNKRFIFSFIGFDEKEYGFIGFEISKEENTILYKQYYSQLKFLSEFSGLVFQRMNLDKVTKHLIICEEKNRIAQDIHDGVSQKLFGVSCLVHSIKKKVMTNREDDILKDMDDVGKILANSISELRATVHGMSSNKDAEELFEEDIRSYIKDMSRMTNVYIDFENYGEFQNISIDIKKAIYRIICEGIGNSIRHGKCKYIRIKLNIFPEKNVLEIIDDGLGFNVIAKLNSKEKGLGLQGIYSLVYKLSGEISILSTPGEGTKIAIILPNRLSLINKGEAI